MPLSVSRKASHTRTRTVFPSHELPHIWAHQSAPLGRCPSSMSFDGAEFYSYGTTIGDIVKTKRGELVYLISDRTHSVTTSKHLDSMCWAIPSAALKFIIPGMSRGGYSSGFSDPKRIMDKWRDHIADKLRDAAKSRRPKNVRLVSEAVSIAEQMRNYGKLMGAKTGRIPRIPTTADEIAKFADLASKKAMRLVKIEAKRKADALQRNAKKWMSANPDYAARWDGTIEDAVKLQGEYQSVEDKCRVAERKAADLAILTAWMVEHPEVSVGWDGTWAQGYDLRSDWQDAARERLVTERLAAWLDGAAVSLPYSYGVTLLRIIGDTVETSRGASFPIAHAVRGLALVRSVIKRGEEWRTNGHTCHLGNYQIDRITADGTVYAGCHTVPFTSIDRIAPALESYRAPESE